MPDTVTPHLGLVKPEINGPQTENVWGFDLNANFDKIDAGFGQFVLGEAPLDGFVYGRSNSAWVHAAPLDSPIFSGVPQAPNANPAAYDTQIATTKFVHDVAAGYAPIADPVFTGNPRAPTPVPGDNDDTIATTAFVTAASIAAGAVFPSNAAPGMNGVPNAGTSTLYSRGDHTHPSDTSRVAKSGDVMTGNLTISTVSPGVMLTKTASTGQHNQIMGQTNSIARWLVSLGDATAEGAGNAGSDFDIHRYANDGAYLGMPFNINRSNGTVSIAQQAVVNGVLFANSGVASTSWSTGSMVVVGGLGVSGNVNIQGGIVGSSFLSLAGSLTMAAGSIINLGGYGYIYGSTGGLIEQASSYTWANLAGAVGFMTLTQQQLNIPLQTASDHYATGALITAGGVGIGKALNAGGFIRSYSGQLFLQGYGGDPNQSIIYLNANNSIYLHNNGSQVGLVGLPLRLTYGGDILGGNEWALYGYSNQSRGRFFYDNTNLWMQATALQFCGIGGAPATSTFTGPNSTATSNGAVVVSGGLGVTGSANLGPTTVWGGLGCTGDFYTSTKSYFNAATPAWVPPWDVAMIVKFTGTTVQFGMGMRPIYDNTTAIGFLRADGQVAVGNIYMTDVAVAYGTASDARLKSDLKPLESGDLIDRIKTYDFAWQNGKRGRGVLAQEAAKVVPEACYEQADTWFTDYSKFVPLLLAEMKALRARVAELEGRA
jgi:hypothetical protein